MRRLILIPILFTALALGACQGPPDEVAVAHPPTMVQVAALDGGGLHHAGPRTVLTVGALGMPAGAGWPEFELLVDGRSMGSVVAATGSLTDYVFEADVAPDEIGEVRVRYKNDFVLYDKDGGRSEDRNLYVYYLKVGEERLPASYKTRIERADGTVQRGQESLWWNADLIFPVAALLD